MTAVRDLAAERPALALSADGGRHTWSVAGRGNPIEVHGSLPGAAHLAGRPGSDVTAPSGAVPELTPWP